MRDKYWKSRVHLQRKLNKNGRNVAGEEEETHYEA